jgi:hypothetical protein
VRKHPRPWGNPPVNSQQVSGPGMDASPTGALSFVQAEPVNNERHYDAGGNRQQELLHKASPPCRRTRRIAPVAIYDNHQRIVKNFYYMEVQVLRRPAKGNC